jgi:hypothetical protein
MLFFLYILLTLVFYRNVLQSHVAISEEEVCGEMGTSILGTWTSPMRLGMKNHMLLSNFTALVQQRTPEKSVFTIKATYQGALHGLVIQVVLFHYASTVANNL